MPPGSVVIPDRKLKDDSTVKMASGVVLPSILGWEQDDLERPQMTPIIDGRPSRHVPDYPCPVALKGSGGLFPCWGKWWQSDQLTRTRVCNSEYVEMPPP